MSTLYNFVLTYFVNIYVIALQHMIFSAPIMYAVYASDQDP